MSFLTAAAPNRGADLRNQPDSADRIPAVLTRRARRVLEVAAAHGHRRLVLGAWGCGVFRNDPNVVAASFAEALAGAAGWFDQVVFAILDRTPGAQVYAAFAARFSSQQWDVCPSPCATTARHTGSTSDARQC